MLQLTTLIFHQALTSFIQSLPILHLQAPYVWAPHPPRHSSFSFHSPSINLMFAQLLYLCPSKRYKHPCWYYFDSATSCFVACQSRDFLYCISQKVISLIAYEEHDFHSLLTVSTLFNEENLFSYNSFSVSPLAMISIAKYWDDCSRL